MAGCLTHEKTSPFNGSQPLIGFQKNSHGDLFQGPKGGQLSKMAFVTEPGLASVTRVFSLIVTPRSPIRCIA
jgi:hypothetical protein